jgi:hypothetical protein
MASKPNRGTLEPLIFEKSRCQDSLFFGKELLSFLLNAFLKRQDSLFAQKNSKKASKSSRIPLFQQPNR